MTLKEFKNAIKDWGTKYDYDPIINIHPDCVESCYAQINQETKEDK